MALGGAATRKGLKMVMDRPERPMDEHDWLVLGHDYHQNGRLTLPALRLHVPIPSCKQDLHALVTKFAKLSQDLHDLARMPYPTRSAIGDSIGLVRLLNQDFKRLRSAWESELKIEAEKPKESNEPNVTKLRIG